MKRICVLLFAFLLLTGCGTAAAPAAVFPDTEAETVLPTPEPTPEPTPAVEAQARTILAGMSDTEKVWQMLYVFPQDVCGSYCCTDQEQWADALLEYPAGGLVFNSDNMTSPESLRGMLSAAAGAADCCPFLGVDEEGGKVARLSYTLGVTTDFLPMFTYREEGTATAFSNARTIAGDLRDFGFNQDFAPVADVWTNEQNTVIGQRAYSDDPQEAAALVAAAVEGFTDGGIISTLKHFPGHGDTREDSHFAAAISGKTADALAVCEFLPFRAGIDAGAGMIMAGHITMTEIDPDLPASLSAAVITGLLREELGWDGVVITDSFRMEAISGTYSHTEAAVLAVKAGCDLLLAPDDPQAAAAALLEQVDMDRIDESVLRILKLKLAWGLIPQP